MHERSYSWTICLCHLRRVREGSVILWSARAGTLSFVDGWTVACGGDTASTLGTCSTLR